jgi:amino acid transporter
MLGALLATSGLFLSSLLTNSRLPFVLARAGQMPAWLAAIDPRSGTPRAAIVPTMHLRDGREPEPCRRRRSQLCEAWT